MWTQGLLLDLLMAVMNSLDVWSGAAGDRARGLAWRDAATRRMSQSGSYVPYEALVADAAADVGLPAAAVPELFARWPTMEPWPDAAALSRLGVPYGFVTNCSAARAREAADRSGLSPAFTLSAEECGWYKPHAAAYQQACRRLGLPPERALFVAGSPYDANGARAAGLATWLVVRRDDQPVPDDVGVVRSLEEVVEALERRAP
jgi:2-haloalkanoic acid dehalogenase type II